MPLVGTIVTTHYDQIAIVNASNSMTDAEGATIVDALNILLPNFCDDWNLKPVSVVFVPKGVLSTIPLKCLVLNSSDADCPPGFQNADGVGVAKVFAKTIIENGGSVLYSENNATPTLAAAVSHEVFELIADVNANMWWNSTSGATMYAAEVCDPVKANVVNVTVSNPDSPSEEVSLSDWILPAWTDPYAQIGPFNHTLTKPLSVDKGGYMLISQNGRMKYIFSDEINSLTKQNICTRSQKRIAKHTSRCVRPGCEYVKHPKSSVAKGTHCCNACLMGQGHGSLCARKTPV